jgi:hypothetical protein
MNSDHETAPGIPPPRIQNASQSSIGNEELAGRARPPHQSPDAAPAGAPPPPLPPRHTAGAMWTSPPPLDTPRRDAERPAPGFTVHYQPMRDHFSAVDAVDALLKRPAMLVKEIAEGRLLRALALLQLVVIVCLVAYGLVMGSFSGGMQFWAVPSKVVLGTLLSALICLPSLYIFTSLSGGRQTFPQTVGLLLGAMGLTSLLLLGFAPIVWIFSQATETTVFMGFLHAGVWITSSLFGLSLLLRACAFLNRRSMGVVAVWSVIFLLVLFQMSTTLRPVLGRSDRWLTPGKQFFLAHWSECMRGNR